MCFSAGRMRGRAQLLLEPIQMVMSEANNVNVLMLEPTRYPRPSLHLNL